MLLVKKVANGTLIFFRFRDPHKLEVYCVEYVVDNGSIAFAVTDADKNLILYTHQVNKPDWIGLNC